MGVIVGAHELAEIAEERGVDCLKLIKAADEVAQKIAKQSGLKACVTNEPGFGGLMASFQVGEKDVCPDDIQRFDAEGSL